MNKFDEKTRQVILEALKLNPSLPSAATKAGIHSNTLRQWLDRGEQGTDEVYSQFALDVAEARATMKDEIVASLFKIATDELHPQATKAAHQLLTNLYPAEFSSVRHVVSHTVKQEELDVSTLPTEELRAFVKTLKKLKSEAEQDGKPLRPSPAPANVIDIASD